MPRLGQAKRLALRPQDQLYPCVSFLKMPKNRSKMMYKIDRRGSGGGSGGGGSKNRSLGNYPVLT